MKKPTWRMYRRTWGQSPVEETEDELQFHFAMRTDELMQRGLSEEEAHARVQREFGDVTHIRRELLQLGAERVRRMRRMELRDGLRQDCATGLRALVRHRAFAALAIGTLALGIGLSTAMFSVVRTVLLRPLPFAEPDELVAVWNSYPQTGLERLAMAADEFTDIRAGAQSFEAVSAASYREVNVTAGGVPERVAALEVSSDFFGTLGVGAELGRTFTNDDVGAVWRSAVLSNELWRTRYGSDPQIVGRTLTIDRQPVVVVGVMPSHFDLPNPGSFMFPKKPVVFLPLDVEAYAAAGRGANYLRVIGRTRDGVGAGAIAAEMTSLGERFVTDNPGHYPAGWRLTAVPLSEQMLGRASGSLLLLSIAVGLVMLIACVNVANLTIARMMGRQREIAIRTALGAGRGRVLRQLLAENLMLAAVAGACGVGMAALLVMLMRVRGPADVPRLDAATLDVSAVLVAIGLVVVTGITLGAVAAHAPATRAIETALRSSARSVAGGRKRLRQALVVFEIALACMVLIGAGLVTRSLVSVMMEDTGLRHDGVITLEIVLPAADYPDAAARNALYEVVRERVRDLPGVMEAAFANPLPLSGDLAEAGFMLEGRPPAGGETVPTAPYASVSPGYLAVLGIPLLRGRSIATTDRADAPRVVVVDAAFAHRFWPGEDPIGKRMHMGGTPDTVWTTVIGVVAATATVSLEAERRPHMYLPIAQRTRASATLLVHSTSSTAALAPALRGVLQQIDRNLPVPALRTMSRIIDESLAARRFTTALLFAFAATALLLAAVGLYGLIAYMVGQRTREIGVRLALGATSRDATRMVLQEGLLLALCGVITGVAAAWMCSRAIARFLFGVTATDPATYAGVAALLLIVAFAASWIPARRAARVPPLTAFGAE